MNSYEYKLGKFKYYARTAKGEETFNPFEENSIEYAEWKNGYDEAFYTQSRNYLAMDVNFLANIFGIKDSDLPDGPEYKMKKDLKATLDKKYVEKYKPTTKKI